MFKFNLLAGNRSIEVPTKLYVSPENWDGRKHCPRAGCPSIAKLRRQLAYFKEKIYSRLGACNAVITPEVLEQIISGGYLNPSDVSRKTTLISYARHVNILRYQLGAIGYSVFKNSCLAIDEFERFQGHLQRTPPTLDTLKPELFESYREYRRVTLKNKCLETIDKAVLPFQMAVRHAIVNGIIPNSEFDRLFGSAFMRQRTRRYAAAEEAAVRYLDDADFYTLHEYWLKLKSGRRKDVLDMFFFSFYCDGLRFSDILTLEWDCIDMDAQLLRKCQYKTRQEVTVPLSPTAMDILRRWSGRRQRFVFRLLDPQTDMTDQQSLYAQRMSKTRSQNGVLCRIGKELNLNVGLTTHVARHTFAVRAINRGVSIYILSNLLGHSSVIATEKTYAKLLPKTLDVARSAIYGGK